MSFKSFSWLFSLPIALAAPVEVSSTFVGGESGAWFFNYVSGPPGLYLRQITIDLSPTGRRFDTVAGGWGLGAFLDVGSYNGTDVATGLTAILPGTGSTLDGSSSVSFYFDDFGPGNSFHFAADVDGPSPPPLVLPECQPGMGGYACSISNIAATVLYQMHQSEASQTLPFQSMWMVITYSLEGPGFKPTVLSGAYNLDANASTNVTQDLVSDASVAEPGSLGLCLTGLALLALGREAFRPNPLTYVRG